MPKINLGYLSNFNSGDKLNTLLRGKIGDGIILEIIKLRENIQFIYEINPDQDYPEWFVESYNGILIIFSNFIKSILENNQDLNYPNIDKIKAVFFNRTPDPYAQINYSLPFLESYARALNSDNQAVIKSIIESLQILKAEQTEIILESKDTLELLNKKAIEIGVEKYAEIFEIQAYEHSRLCKKKGFLNYAFRYRPLGKAQWWMLYGLVFFILLIYASFKINDLFNFSNQTSFNPTVIVMIIGRSLLISSLIFLISFSFKQYRVNMHLYTLNKHRANTLKSFEYLTKSPERIDNNSYNSILMEVAKAIYESGQTGYINNSDSNSEMPSLVDLSKIIRPGK
jgi:hypothetical protein